MPTRSVRLASDEQEAKHGTKEIELAEEIERTQIRQESAEDRGKRDAAAQARHLEIRQRRKRRQGEEPQAGDRDRSFGGAQEGREGPSQEETLVLLVL